MGALRCELTAEGTPAKVWYFEYRDNAAMDTAYKPYTDGTFVAGDCTAKGQKMDYTPRAGQEAPGRAAALLRVGAGRDLLRLDARRAARAGLRR